MIKAAIAWLILLGLALPVCAHHSRSNFDFDQPLRFAGVVTEFRWGNPHLYVKVRDDHLLDPVKVSGRLLKETDRVFFDEPCTRENARLHLVGE